MSKTVIPSGYRPVLDLYQTQTAIGCIKRNFETRLCEVINLKRVSAPLFVEPSTGLNDDLNGVERAVSFDVKETGRIAQVVHSLAKWKRMALYKYGFEAGEGLYTDMNAIRRDEEMDNLHSIYVDQWDWEKVIALSDRNVDYLKSTVRSIVGAIVDTLDEIKKMYPSLPVTLSKEVSFVTTQELEDMYPSLTPKERENEYLKIHKTAFVMQIGGKLKSGIKHDGRAPDYDDWDLNGDILIWDEVLGSALEVSSMGIRVNAESLIRQLRARGAEDRLQYEYHSKIASGEYPLTIGGGIGQSRICMLLLEKAHIGEVHCSVWPKAMRQQLQEQGIVLL